MQTNVAGPACDAIGSLVSSYEHLGARHAERHGLHVTDFRALLLLTRREKAHEATSAGTLARELGLSSGAVTYLLERLTTAGLVDRSSDPADRRRVIVASTARGRHCVDTHEKVVADTVGDALQGLDRARRAEVGRVAADITRGLAEHAASD